MKITIIFHSLTGSTLRMAKLIESKLVKSGHFVTLTQLQTNVPVKTGSIHQPMSFEITNLPDIADFDAIIAGGPVWGFCPSPVIYKAITGLKNLKGKKLLPFVTMGLPLRCLGGRNSIKHMSKAAAENGATVLQGVIVPKGLHNFELLMEQGAEDCVNYISH
jgi:hypothetical protein